MFRFFENLVDPYVEYKETDTPPRRLLPFLIDYARPFRRVFVVTGVLKMVVAVIEVGMIWYVGRLVDLLAQGSPAAVMRDHGAEFLFAAIAVLFLRPVIGGIDVALLHNMHSGAIPASVFIDFDAGDLPVRCASGVQPVVEELLPAFAGKRFQFMLDVRGPHDAEAVIAIQQSGEFKEAVAAEPVLNHANDAGAFVIHQEEQIMQMADLVEIRE